MTNTVIERDFLQKLPEIFTSVYVFAMTDSEITRLGGESSEVIHRRQELQTKVASLEEAKLILENHVGQDEFVAGG